MGDRANIYVVDTEDATRGIYLYTHSNGYEWPEHLRAALEAARPRWGDESYCTRILITELYKDLIGSETGGGISTRVGDNEYNRPITVVDQIEYTVSFAAEGNEADREKWFNTMSFDEYVTYVPATYPRDQ